MNTIIPIASGKGGVGKTIFTANLGITLAKMGKTVIAIDLDLGSSNLHTCLGIKNRHPGIGNFIYNKGVTLESLIVKTDFDRLYFIPGDSLIPGTANLQYFIKKKLLKAIQNLVADYVLIDLGAGSSYNIIDFFLISKTGLLITTPETTSILSAYAFLKSTVFRMLFRSFPVKSKERELIHNFLTERIEGTDNSFLSLTKLLRTINPVSGDYALKQINGILDNQGRAASKTIEFLKEKKVQVKEIIQIVTSYNELVNNCSPIGEQACANLTKTIEEAINKLTPLQKD